MQVIEFWPDYGSGPLWGEDGRAIDPRSVGLSARLASELAAFNRSYSEDFIEEPASAAAREYRARGRGLLSELRRELAGVCQVVVVEGWDDD